MTYQDYLATIQSAEKSGVSITDFVLSILLPQISQNGQNIPVNISTNNRASTQLKLPLSEKAVSDSINDNSSKEFLLSAKRRYEEINNLKIQ